MLLVLFCCCCYLAFSQLLCWSSNSLTFSTQLPACQGHTLCHSPRKQYPSRAFLSADPTAKALPLHTAYIELVSLTLLLCTYQNRDTSFRNCCSGSWQLWLCQPAGRYQGSVCRYHTAARAEAEAPVLPPSLPNSACAPAFLLTSAWVQHSQPKAF